MPEVYFQYLVCSVDVILKWGFPMTEASYGGCQAAGRTWGGLAKQTLYHLHRNTESDFELVMDLNDDDMQRNVYLTSRIVSTSDKLPK